MPNRVVPNRVVPNRVVPNRVVPNRVVPNRMDQFCDSEIQQVRFAVFAHKNVSRFQIPVNHQVLVSELDGRAHLKEQP
jgi:hypothetical protein